MTDNSIQDLLPLVEKPSQYLGSEINRIHKDLDKMDVTITLAFPDLYEIGTSHFGLQILYELINRQPNMAAERVFAPGPDMAAALQASATPLATLESQQPLSRFDIIGFSLLYELNYTNILTILDLAGIPFLAKDRSASHPLIIAGGPATCNPEPVADFFDAMVIGEGETVLLEMLHVWLSWKRQDQEDRQRLLVEWSRIHGVYIPALVQVDFDDSGFQRVSPDPQISLPIRRAIVPDLDVSPFPTAPVIPFGRPVHDRLRLEIARGCTRGCRFCQAGMIYRPVRERSLPTILGLTEKAMAATGYEELSLLSLSSGDYSCLTPLLDALMHQYASRHVAVSLPSLRAGTLTPAMMQLIKTVRKTGFTLAPEAGSQRLRDVINKNISHAEIISTVQNAFELGWLVIKLYFMIGLPTETQADLQAIVDLVKELRRLPGSSKRQRTINVSITTFIPKPHVPFQWEPQLSMETAQAKIRWLKQELRSPGVQLKWQNPETSQLEGLFARGDRKLSRLLQVAFSKGCRLDGWSDQFNFSKWKESFAEAGIDVAFYTTRPRSVEEPLPWDHIQSGVEKSFLICEREAALMGKSTPDCRQGVCNLCGVCDFKTIEPKTFSSDQTAPLALSSKPLENSRFTYQLTYSKTGNARFFGHLELVNILLRALCRAGIPVKYSEGFHPKPRISFGNPLPVGLESSTEFCSLVLTQVLPIDGIMEKLNAQLPDGLRIENCRLGSPVQNSFTDLEYRYQITLVDAVFDAEAIERFHSQPVFNFSRTNQKGKLQNINLKDMVRHMDLESPNQLLLSLRVTGGQSVRPMEIIACIFDLPDTSIRKARIMKNPEASGLSPSNSREHV